MKNVRNLSANALQLVINQLFGLGIFYILSVNLDKASFGQINLALAVSLAVFNILSFGIDQLIIKRIAAGAPVQKTISLCIFHVLMAGLGYYGLLLLGKAIFPQAGTVYNLILLIGIGKLAIFFSTPFKQVTSGLERFKILAVMAVISNLIRCVSLTVALFIHQLSVPVIIAVFIAGDVLELCGCLLLFRGMMASPLKLTWNMQNYFSLLRESLPQTGVVIITSALARFDWLFIGFMLSAVKLAEYSFAYKAFEIATLPLLSIAPLLIPRFTKIFGDGGTGTFNMRFMLRAEIIIALFTALMVNIYWTPLVDAVTGGKYGAVNSRTIFLLSLCMPLLYVNNFLWTIFFAQGRLKMILHSFIITLLVNVIGDMVLIPIYKNEGAAVAFFLSCLAQTIFYLSKNELGELKNTWQPLVVCTICALASGIAAKYVFPQSWLVIPLSGLFYFICLLITRQVKLSDRRELKLLLK